MKVRRSGRRTIDLGQRVAPPHALPGASSGTASSGAAPSGTAPPVAPERAAWTLRRRSTSATEAPLVEALPASVPGCVHRDLERAGAIEALERTGDGPTVDWIGRSSWSFERTFTVDAAFAAAPRHQLVFHGLQGVATVLVDGRELGVCDNQFRRWTFELEDLAAGEHRLEVRFADTFEWLAERESEAGRTLPGWGVGQDKDHTGAWLRASPVMFGWDFAPRAVTCGIWKDVELVALDGPQLDLVRVAQQHRRDGSVRVRVDADIDASPAANHDAAVDAGTGASGALPEGSDLRAVLVLDGVRVAHARARLVGTSGDVFLEVDRPALWWPNGEGEQRLYDLWVELRAADGSVLDRTHRRIGLRTVELVCRPDEGGESFLFRVNGRDLAIRGANVVPQTLFDADEVEPWRVIGDASHAGMNMLRVWGGGPYASDAFYDTCDEHGVLVWQDMPFACCTYPTFDAAFRANVEAELREQCRRLHAHASLALFCGNNELENGLCADEWDADHMSWKDYALLFDELCPRVVAEEAPQVTWWPGSPHTPAGDRAVFNDPRSGDAHLWDVWHGEEPFEWYLTSKHRFVSEFGFQSPPEPTRLRRLVGGDLRPEARAVAHRQRAKDGDARIDRYLAREGVDVGALDPVRRAHLARLVHARGMQLAMEHWRRAWPHCGGFLMWQLNEPWLGSSWAAIDGEDGRKPLGALLADICTPRLVTLHLEADDGRTLVRGHWVDNETRTDTARRAKQESTISWSARLYRIDGHIDDDELDEFEGEQPLSQGTNLLFERDLDDWIGAHGLTRGQVEIEIEVSTSDGASDEEALVPAPLGAWEIDDPQLEVLFVRHDPSAPGWFTVDVRVHTRAWYPVAFHPRYVVALGDPFDEIEPGDDTTLYLHAEGTRSPERLADGLQILTLYDLVGRGARKSERGR